MQSALCSAENPSGAGAPRRQGTAGGDTRPSLRFGRTASPNYSQNFDDTGVAAAGPPGRSLPSSAER